MHADKKPNGADPTAGEEKSGVLTSNTENTQTEPGHLTEKELEEVLAKTVEPPDGGWGWVVVLSSFIIHIIVDGITYSFGVFFVALLEDFQGSKGGTAWILSIFVGMTLGTGPIASGFVNIYGCRAVTIAGAVVGAIGFIMSSFAPALWFLYISIGIISGFGFGLIYLPAIVVVSYYFEKRRALATGLACCGSGFGTFIVAPFLTFLIDEYGWKQTCFWLAGLILQVCIFGALFRPLPIIDNTAVLELLDPNENKSPHPSIQLNGKSVSETHVVAGSPSNRIKAPSAGPSRSRISLNQLNSLNSLNNQELHGHQLKQHITLHRKDVFYSGSLHNIPLYEQNKVNYVTSNMSLNHSLHQAKEAAAPPAAAAAPAEEGCCSNFTSSLKEMIDFTLLKDWAFVLFLFSNLFTNFGFNAPFLFIPDRALSYGMDKHKASFLVSIVGIANTGGRVLFGYLADLKWIKPYRIHLYNTGLLIAGLSTCFSYSQTYAGQIVYSITFGVFIGCYVSLTAIVLVDLLGVDKLTSSFGVTLLIQGVAVLIGPPACGWIYDATGDYLWPFVVTGATIAVSGLMLYMLPVLSRMQHGKNREQNAIDMGVRIAVSDVKENPVVDEEVALTNIRQRTTD